MGPWGSYYEVLDIAPTAAADEIKRAFRREIAKYHPDKVQHLGREFQEIAAVKAAELTQAYKTLSDEALRADYDAQLKATQTTLSDEALRANYDAHLKAVQTAAAPSPPPPEEPDPGPRADSRRQPDESHRAGASDLVRKAALQRFRHALKQEFGDCEETPIPGFDVMGTPPKSGFLSRTVPPRLLGRVVDQVDAAAVHESRAMAMRMKKEDQRQACIFVMGPLVASAADLGRAINEQRRRPMPSSLKLVVVPVNTRTWAAHIPTDAPPQVKAFLTRLAAGL